jgi:hypothetical protein
MEGTEKLDIAKELLEVALFLYYEKEQYYASLHLAGASEEILGAYVKAKGGEPVFESINTGARKVAELFSGQMPKKKDMGEIINRARNSTKHMDGEHDSLVFLMRREKRLISWIVPSQTIISCYQITGLK